MEKLFYRLRTMLNTGIFGLGAIVWLFVTGIVCLPGLWLFPGKNGRNVRKFVYYQSKGILLAMRLSSTRWKVEKITHPQEPCIVVANHASALDLYTVAALGLDNVVYITKGWVFGLPFFRFIMKNAGYMDAETTPPDEMLARCQEALKNGCDIVVFPQGSRKNPQARFKSGAFFLAEKTNATILPMAIVGTGNMLPVGTIKIHPARIKLVGLPPIYPKDYLGELAHLEMAREAKNRIMEVVNKGA